MLSCIFHSHTTANKPQLNRCLPLQSEDYRWRYVPTPFLRQWGLSGRIFAGQRQWYGVTCCLRYAPAFEKDGNDDGNLGNSPNPTRSVVLPDVVHHIETLL